MKKMTALILTIVMVFSFATNLVFANGVINPSDTETEVIVTIESGTSATLPKADYAKNENLFLRGTQVPTTSLDLAVSNDKPTHQYKSLVYGNYLYTNHGGTIKITVWNENTFDQDFTLTLYDSTGTKVSSSALSIGARVVGLFNYKTVTFSDLSSSKKYYYTLTKTGDTYYDQTVEVKK